MGVILLVGCFIVPASGQGKAAAVSQESASDWNSLIGEWKVSLRSSSGEVMGTTMFLITEANGKTVRGSFYGSPLRQVHVASVDGTLHFAFTTSDVNSLYHGTARFAAGRLEGSTHALDRGFLSVWTAERLKP